MLRILVDPLGDGHRDIVLKLDATPGIAKIADSYYLSAFLGIEDATNDFKAVVLGYIEYLVHRITSLNGQQAFLPFEFDDHYIGGVLLTPAQKGLFQLKYVWSDKLTGWNIKVKEANFDGAEWKWENDGEWLLSPEAILQGLDWSKRMMIESK